MPMSENKKRALNGELYYAFTPEMVAERRRCQQACARYNNAGDVTRRKRVELWRDIVGDKTPLPSVADTAEADEELFSDDPWVEPPINVDYGTNLKVGKNVFINFNCTILDTCEVTIKSGTLIAANVSLYSGTHPLDPNVRQGTRGPELGGKIVINEDCWLGGSATILPGVVVGQCSTVGAGSIVTKNVEPYTVVAGNPARKIKQVPIGENDAEVSAARAALERDRAREKESQLAD